MSIQIDISLGEFLDKLTILEIKREKITDQSKRVNVNREYELLMQRWKNSDHAKIDISADLEALKQANETLWEIEDKIRDKEAKKEFDAVFIELARSVYLTNDRRAEIKRRLNQRLQSGLQEEKSYKDY